MRTNGRKFPVGNSPFHFLKRGYLIQVKMKRKLGKRVPLPGVQERGWEARRAVGCSDQLCAPLLCRSAGLRSGVHDHRRLQGSRRGRGPGK